MEEIFPSIGDTVVKKRLTGSFTNRHMLHRYKHLYNLILHV